MWKARREAKLTAPVITAPEVKALAYDVPGIKILEVGKLTFTIKEATAAGITPTKSQIEKGFVSVTPAEIEKIREVSLRERYEEIKWKPGDPLIRYEPKKSKLFLETLLAEPSEITEVDIRKFERETSYEELAKRGMWTSIIRKASRDTGKGYLKGIDTALVQITGKAPMTEGQLQRWGDFFGETGLFLFFSPVFKTGAYKKQTKTTQKQISKKKFDKISKKLGALERKIANQKTLKAQLRILKDIKAQLKTPEARADFEKFLQSLMDKGIIILPKYDISSPIAKKVAEQAIMFTKAPQIPTSVVVAGLISAEAVKQVSYFGTLGFRTKEARQLQKEQQKLLQLNKQVQKQQQKVSQATTQSQKQFQQQKLSQLQKQLQRQSQKYLSAQLQLQRQVQRTKQTQKTKQQQRQKQVPKFFTMTTSILKAPTKVKAKPRPIGVRVTPKIPKPLKFKFFFPTEVQRKRIAKLPKEKKRQLYDVLIKRQKKFKKIADDLPINKAKKLGALFVDEESLAATFTIIKDKLGRTKDIPKFKPDPKIFRDYRISRGQRVPLKNMWIEKKQHRLSSKKEIFALLKARQNAPKKKNKPKKSNPSRRNNPKQVNLFGGKKQINNWLK